jgi:uncharacterized repeat protein (TIGR01451 family)
MTTSPSFAGTLENRVTIGAGNADELFTPDNVDTVNVSVQGAPSLTITKTADPSGGNVRPDQTIYYTIIARNTGGVSATDVVISDTLPAGVGLVSVITSSGIVTSTTPLNVFASTLPAGNAITVTVQVTVTTGVSGTLLNNQASLDSNETGPAFSQIVSHRVITGTGIVYLPIIMKNWGGTAPPAPSNANLRVIDIGFVGGTPPTEGVNYDIYVVVSNVGTDTVNTPFWVDLYLNPVTLPTANQPWQNLSRSGSGYPATACKDDPTCYGRAWRVTSPLAPGAVVTLTTQMPADERYDRWPTGGAPYSSRHNPIVALVDSWGFWYGAVYENNETDNLSGSISGSGLSGSETTLELPPRSLSGPGGEAPHGDEAGMSWPPGRPRPSLPAPQE